MKFKSDRQRRACFANMNGNKFSYPSDSVLSSEPKYVYKDGFDNEFSKGRIPKIGEVVFVHGDESVGIPSWNGEVVATHDNSVDVKYKTKSGYDVTELGLEEFDDEEDMKFKKEIDAKLYEEWLSEQRTKKLEELWADVVMSGREDPILRGVLAARRMGG